MSLPTHLQMINQTGSSEAEGADQFHCFQLLPKELRLKIWRHAMQQQRFLKVSLKDRRRCLHGDYAIDSMQERYCAHIDGHQILPKLYTRQTEGPENSTRETLYLNPENDYLFISPEWSVKDSFFDFFNHMKNIHDPQNIGILNIAINSNSLNSNDFCLLKPSDIDPEELEATREILTHLREVFFVSTPRVGRQVMGITSGLATGDTFWNRSLPIMARPSTFKRLKRDPRNITDDLQYLELGMSDPQTMYAQWQDFLDKWVGPSRASRTQYHFLLAFDPIIGAGEGILDREAAEEFLHREEDHWTRNKVDYSSTWFAGRDDLKWPIGATPEEYEAQDKSGFVKPAFGFWLFPVETVDSPQEKGVPESDGSEQHENEILDPTKRWPELALLNVY